MQYKFTPERGRVYAIAPRAWGEDVPELMLLGGPTAPAFTEQGVYAVVDICGPLAQHSHALFCSYDDIRERVKLALTSNRPEVALKIHSPGGDFAGCIELARDLRSMCAAAGKRLCAFTDSRCLSAAYAIACAAEDIVATNSALLGSIGVWSALFSEKRRNDALGLDIVVVPSGEKKAERNPHVPITDTAVSHMQVEIDAMANMFYEWVAETRRLSSDKIESLQGGELLGSKAVASGLANSIVNSWESFLTMSTQPTSTPPSAEKEEAMVAKASGKYLDEAKVALRRAAEDDDEEQKKMALKALKALEGPEEEKKETDDGEKSKAEGEDEEKKASAAAPDSDSKMRAAARSDSEALAQTMALARRVQELEAAAQAKAEAEERAKLLSTRPDFDKSVRDFLAGQPISAVKQAVETFPRAVRPNLATSQFTTSGVSNEPMRTALDAAFAMSPEDEARLDRTMGIKSAGTLAFSVGCGDVEAARKYLASKGGK